MTVHSINIGGGPKFQADGWRNFDHPFVLSPHCVLPIDDRSLELVYSSHTLEHLDDGTVTRVLSESRRVLKSGGTLLIKIPDFDNILERYRNNDLYYFKRWPNIRVMTETAANRGVKCSLVTLAAQCFCGFWNKEFGHMFLGYNIRNPGAYYGPPVMSEHNMRVVMAFKSPHAIASFLRAHVVANESDYTFNHQNAWSREEFRALLAVRGFAISDDDTDRIIASHAKVPGIVTYREISAYYMATPL